MRCLHRKPQALPVRLHQTNGLFVLTTPMPGLKPQDIVVRIRNDSVALRGIEHGPMQPAHEMLLDEWTIGPYYREVSLPQPVNGPLTNVTYGNGVLVLTMPKRDHNEQTIPAELQLQTIESTRGEHIGHTGSAVQPTTTQAHMQKHKAE